MDENPYQAPREVKPGKPRWSWSRRRSRGVSFLVLMWLFILAIVLVLHTAKQLALYFHLRP